MSSSLYPGGIDSFTTAVSGATITSAQENLRNSAIVEIESTLATNPQGSYSTVLANIEARLDTNVGGTMAASINMGSNGITGLPLPVNPNDAANKLYVDNVAQGLSAKPSAVNATTSALPGPFVYANGSSGVGATLTAAANGAFPAVDGVTLSTVGQYILVMNEAAPANNGLYSLTTVGNGSTKAVLTRAVEMDVSSEFQGAYVFIEQGTINASTGWVCLVTSPPVVGTDPITFTQFTGAGDISAGNGLSKSGNILSAALGNGLQFDGSNNIAVEGTSGQIAVGSGGVSIDSTYVGQTSITTLGTITSGAWQGTPVAVADGGTGSTSASGARSNLGAAASGANGDITSLTGLTTPLSVGQGGTAATSASGARSNLVVPSAGDNFVVVGAVPSELTGGRQIAAGTGLALTDGGAGGSLTLALSTPVSIANGGTNATTAAGALSNLGAASAVNVPIQATTITLTSAQIKGMFSTAVTIVPAQSGGIIILNWLDFTYTFATTAYTGGGLVRVGYVGIGDGVMANYLNSTFITAASTQVTTMLVRTDNANMFYSNLGLEIANLTAAFATGDGTLKITTYWHLLA